MTDEVCPVGERLVACRAVRPVYGAQGRPAAPLRGGRTGLHAHHRRLNPDNPPAPRQTPALNTCAAIPAYERMPSCARQSKRLAGSPSGPTETARMPFA